MGEKDTGDYSRCDK